jgi:uncharacterized repeat protein (TIGR03803 family)
VLGSEEDQRCRKEDSLTEENSQGPEEVIMALEREADKRLIFVVSRRTKRFAISAIGVALAFCLFSSQTTEAQSFKVITDFPGQHNASHPEANLTQDAAGNLYGTTSNGGVYNDGAIFQVTRSGKETVLYSFTGENLAQPVADVITDRNGNFYGTTKAGGTLADDGGVYKLTASGEERLLHEFTGGSDGATPLSNLVLDSDGNLYGTTIQGGNFNAGCGGAGGCGVVFEITSGGEFSVLHAFSGPDGSQPFAGVILDASGNLYGTTAFGGAHGWGTVFELDLAGNVTVLYSFEGKTDGKEPMAGLALDSGHNLYGTTQYGGSFGAYPCNDGCGVVFKLPPDGHQTVLHAFTSVPDGAFPLAAPVLDREETLYGTTQQGGTGIGTAFSLKTNGSDYSVLHSFTGGSDGDEPVASLLVDSQGNLYGTADFGGRGAGTVFELRP